MWLSELDVTIADDLNIKPQTKQKQTNNLNRFAIDKMALACPHSLISNKSD